MKIEPIRIHHADTEADVLARHEQIERRLDELGAETVKSMIGHGFPTTWNPIITAWLNGGRVNA